MFIQTEATSNPARLTFLPGRQVLAQGTLEVHDRAQAPDMPLARRLFEISGVSGMTLGTDYITVTTDGGDWQVLKPMILAAIMEHFTSAPAEFREEPIQTEGAADPIARKVKEALRRVIDPELGYNIVDLGLVYDVAADGGGGVHITMTTTTPGCPATNYLVEGARESASRLQTVETVEVQLTYEPRWTPEMMSAVAKARFGIRDRGGW